MRSTFGPWAKPQFGCATRSSRLSARKIRFRSGGLWLRARAGCREALQIERVEIDRIDVERRIGAAAKGVRDDLAGEGEQEPRALDHHHRLHLLGGKILDPKHPGVVELE